MVILTSRSPYLRRILSTNVKKNDGTLAHIKLPNISSETFQIILRYIYGGRLSLKEYDVSGGSRKVAHEIPWTYYYRIIRRSRNCSSVQCQRSKIR
ncbi:unnamed protein product [Rhizophagus irregularis]|uniref:BTB domain-containing protein n=1 Tax=Rhizophagus irregularis TaxID=588596 RepID=A0A2I1G534_9GLOM|nr:hypothetical protein RhiirA4_60865 [Rhizophagus irregularis]CAB4442533.1 unnamed protein product [Rhizophagus irregularis]